MQLPDGVTVEQLREVLVSAGLDAADIETVVRTDEAESISVERCDFRAKIGNVTKTDEGYIQGTAAVAKVGILTYCLPNGGTRRELVTDSCLFNTTSMTSLKMKPVTDTHPAHLVSSATAGRKKVGFTGETVGRKDDFLTTSLVVTDDEAIKSIDGGRHELSPGYRAEVLMRPGTFNNEKYDGIQVRRTYNHLALCDRARGGQDLRINFDQSTKFDGFAISEDPTSGRRHSDNHTPPNQRSRFMKNYVLDGISYEADEQVVNHVRKVEGERDDFKTKLDAKTTELETITAERDTLKTKNDELEAAAKDEKGIKARVDARLKLVEVAKDCLDEEDVKKLDDMTDLDIQKAVIVKRFPDTQAKMDDKDTTPEYIAARFDTVAELVAKENEDDKGKGKNKGKPGARNDGLGNQRKKSATRTDDDGERDGDKARGDMADRTRNSWKEEKPKKDA